MQAQPQSGGGNAIASMVLGIIGMLAWFVPIAGLPVTITGLVLGIKGRESVNRGMAITGIVLSIIGLVATVANISVGAYMGATGQHPLLNQVASSPQSPASPVDSSVTGSAYQIAPADGWQVANNGAAAGGPELVISAPPANEFTANLNVVIVPSATGETLENDKAQLAEAYPKMFANYAQLSQGDTTVGGISAFYNTATYDMGTPPRKIWIHQVFVLKNNQAYTFTCTALNSNYRDYEGAFKSMLESVRWTS